MITSLFREHTNDDQKYEYRSYLQSQIRELNERREREKKDRLASLLTNEGNMTLHSIGDIIKKNDAERQSLMKSRRLVFKNELLNQIEQQKRRKEEEDLKLKELNAEEFRQIQIQLQRESQKQSAEALSPLANGNSVEEGGLTAAWMGVNTVAATPDDKGTEHPPEIVKVETKTSLTTASPYIYDARCLTAMLSDAVVLHAEEVKSLRQRAEAAEVRSTLACLKLESLSCQVAQLSLSSHLNTSIQMYQKERSSSMKTLLPVFETAVTLHCDHSPCTEPVALQEGIGQNVPDENMVTAASLEEAHIQANNNNRQETEDDLNIPRKVLSRVSTSTDNGGPVRGWHKMLSLVKGTSVKDYQVSSHKDTWK